MPTLHERYKGALVGVLAGDALGAPYETWSSQDILMDYLVRGGLVPFSYPDPWGKDGDFPAGRPTDDSELTAALAESLVECKGIDLEDQYRRFKRAALMGQSFLWDGVVKGFGGTTRKTLAADSYKESLELPNLPHVASNGSLMRSAPLGLLFRNASHSVLRKAVRNSSYVTHRHHTARECCAVYAQVLVSLLNGLEPGEAIFDGFVSTDDWMIAKEIMPFSERPDIPPKWPRRGDATLTLRAALWGLMSANDFREGISNVVALGGDTDTYAAVAGSLLGARFGIAGIPDEWKSILKGGSRMEELADGLYELHTII